MTFQDWITELNRLAAEQGQDGKPLSEQTGEECWRASFDDGYTPAEALAEDATYG